MPEQAPPAGIRPPGGENSARAGSPLFLLVDDDSMVGRFIGHAAESFGYRAVRTTNGGSFARMFLEERPDAVAIDLRMPGSDGVSLLRFLADQHFGGRVIVVSGLDRTLIEATVRLGKMLGLSMAEPLEKPFRLDAFEQRLMPDEKGTRA